jgi:hypothetical protein
MTGDSDTYGSSRKTDDDSYGSGRTGGMTGDSDTHGSSRKTDDDSYGSSGRTQDTGYGSGATSGAGYGNKKSSYGEDSGDYRGSEGMGEHNKAYSGGNDSYGSGTTGGAGYGNKTGSYGDDEDSSKKDSTAGKLMEKVGGLFKNENMERKGAEKRSQAGRDEDESNY